MLQHIYNRVLESITVAISTAVFDLTTVAFAYKNNGKTYLTSGITGTGAISLAPAFVASTAYIKGEAIDQAGNYYTAKKDFTSGAAFDASDWDLLEATALTASDYRWYTVGVRYTWSAYKIMVLPGQKGLIADGYKNPSEVPDFVDAGSGFTPILFILAYGAITPGSTTLTTSNTKVVQIYGNVGA